MDKTNLLEREDFKWYDKQEETPETLMQDTGKGEPVVIRLFEYRFPPTIKDLPTKEQVLTNDYIRHLQVQLWADDLRLITEPRVVIDKEGIKIFAPCQARAGSNFLEQPKLLQEWTRE